MSWPKAVAFCGVAAAAAYMGGPAGVLFGLIVGLFVAGA